MKAILEGVISTQTPSQRMRMKKCVEESSQVFVSEGVGRNKVELEFIRFEQIAEQTGGFSLTILLGMEPCSHFSLIFVGVGMKTIKYF